jgi:hypothetical protein
MSLEEEENRCKTKRRERKNTNIIPGSLAPTSVPQFNKLGSHLLQPKSGSRSRQTQSRVNHPSIIDRFVAVARACGAGARPDLTNWSDITRTGRTARTASANAFGTPNLSKNPPHSRAYLRAWLAAAAVEAWGTCSGPTVREKRGYRSRSSSPPPPRPAQIKHAVSRPRPRALSTAAHAHGGKSKTATMHSRLARASFSCPKAPRAFTTHRRGDWPDRRAPTQQQCLCLPFDICAGSDRNENKLTPAY